MKNYIFILFLFFASPAFAISATFMNSSSASVLFVVSGPDASFPVAANSVLVVELPSSWFYPDETDFLTDIYVFDTTFSTLLASGSGSAVGDSVDTFYAEYSPDGYGSLVNISTARVRSPVTWALAWQVLAIGCGMVVVPFTLSMALRAVRRGLNTNLPLS